MSNLGILFYFIFFRTHTHTSGEQKETYITTSEVTSLKHEVGDDTVKAGALITVTLLACAEGTEVLGRLGNNIFKEVHVDTTRLFC